MCAKSVSPTEVESLKDQYHADLPCPELLELEIERWYAHHPATSSSITAAMDSCDRDIFPNVHTLLQIGATLPVTTCEAERSFSSLRRLNTYLRASQGAERLDALALINIHCQEVIDTEQVIGTFAKLHQRRLELSSVFFKE